MVTAKTCCCCMTLRTGTYMAAVFSLIIGVMGVVECVLLWIGVNVAEQHGSSINSFENDMVAMSITVLKITIYVAMGIYAAWALFALLAMTGVNCERRCLLLPWMVFTGIVTGLCIWGIISNAKSFAEKIFQDPHQASVHGIQVAVVLINIYSMCIVSSFYRNDLREYDEEFSSIPTMIPAGVDEEYPYKE